MAISGLSSALSAIQRQNAALERASDKIARATTAESGASQAPTSQAEADALESQGAALVDGTVEMMVARRMFTASLKMAQVANEGITEALRLGDYDAAA